MNTQTTTSKLDTLRADRDRMQARKEECQSKDQGYEAH